MIPTLFLVTIIVFGTVRFIPGSVIDIMASEMEEFTGMGEALTEDYIKELLGLDEPLHVKYGQWLGGVIQGDLGKSLWESVLPPIIVLNV